MAADTIIIPQRRKGAFLSPLKRGVASIYNGTPIEQDAIVITGNRVGAGWQQASVALGPYVTNSWVVNNFLASAVTEDATCSGNTITPNY